ncbi:MAG TPA: hydrogen peroxide-dependent heme synthase [Verrucomicrobiales bacterium]|nr:hydrogen peroxide-dependent heme synthase [Verrucomicrobiales bacterium]
MSQPSLSPPETESSLPSLAPVEGWHVLHLFYHIEHGQWSLLSADDQIRAKTNLTRLVQEIRATPQTQLLVFSMLTPKADIGFMLLTPDLHTANAFEKKLNLSLGTDVLTPSYSYLSMTEWTEYVSSEEEYAAKVTAEKGIQPGTPEHAAEMETFHKHMAKYRQDRLYPNMPDWQIFCFYPMSKRRNDGNNWFAQPFAERRKLMAGHATTGRKYSGRVRQLITGSTGLDEHEWGVTLFAHNTSAIKEIVYEMRFDEVSARFAEFGDFYIGIQLPLDELFRRVLL